MAESWREKETTAPKENALVLRGVGQDGLASRKLSGDPIALYLLMFPFFAPPAATAILRVSSKGQTGGMGALSFINGPSWPAFAAFIRTSYTEPVLRQETADMQCSGAFLSLVLVSAAATTVSPT